MPKIWLASLGKKRQSFNGYSELIPKNIIGKAILAWGYSAQFAAGLGFACTLTKRPN
jgi:hypothetical protein